MDYDIVEKELQRISNSDLTKETINEVPGIINNIWEAYWKELPKNLAEIAPYVDDIEYEPKGKKARNHRNETIKRLERIIYNKLKENLDLDKETLKKTVTIICHHKEKEPYRDIYALNGEAVLGVFTDDFGNRGLAFDSRKEYNSMTSSLFTNGTNEELQKKFVSVINCVLDSLPENIENRRVYYEDGICNPTGLGVRLDRPLREISSENNKNVYTTMIIKSYSRMYTFLIRCNNGVFEISKNNNNIINVFNELNKEKKNGRSK